MLVLSNSSDTTHEDVQLSTPDADHQHSNHHILYVGQRKHQMGFTELGNCDEEFPFLLVIKQDGGLWLIVMTLLLRSLKDPSSYRLSNMPFQSHVHLIHILRLMSTIHYCPQSYLQVWWLVGRLKGNSLLCTQYLWYLVIMSEDSFGGSQGKCLVVECYIYMEKQKNCFQDFFFYLLKC